MLRSILLVATLVAHASHVLSVPTATTEPCAQVSEILSRNESIMSAGYTKIDADTAYVG